MNKLQDLELFLESYITDNIPEYQYCKKELNKGVDYDGDIEEYIEEHIEGYYIGKVIGTHDFAVEILGYVRNIIDKGGN